MTSRKSVRIGICVMCGLVLAGAMASSASATTNGVTVFTCKKTLFSPQFSDNHCKDKGSPNLEYTHQSVQENTTTATTGSAPAETIIKATVAGSALQIKASNVTSSGWITNSTDGNLDHLAHGEGATTFTGVTATAGCKVFTDSGAGEGEEGVIHTEALKTTTLGQGDATKYEPKEGTTIARFQLKSCTNSGINGTYTLTGTFKGTPTGATTNFSHTSTTTDNTLKLNGTIKAGLEGSLTYVGRDPVIEETYTPLAFTTVS